jgi:DNA-directed RNA polymerase subunit RPC12/RpoP
MILSININKILRDSLILGYPLLYYIIKKLFIGGYMEKYYRVSEVKEIIKKLAKEPGYQHAGEDFYAGVYTVEDALTDLEEVELEEPKVGKWIPASNKPGVHAGMKCSECKARITYSEHFNGQHLYCHKCGAKMIKEKDPEYTFRTYAGVPGYESNS